MKVKIAPEGPSLSRIVAGVMQWGKWGKEYNTAEYQKLIEKCVALGISSFDHADIYGHYTTEAEWGKAFKSCEIKREAIEIITKCGINLVTQNKPHYKIKSYSTTGEHIISSVDQSLQNLKTDYIDLLLIHRPNPLMHAAEVAEAFTKLKGLGKVRYFGVSNFTPTQFDLLNSFIPLVTNQIEASLLHTNPIYDGTLDQCQKLSIKPMAWSPMGGGKVFGMEQEDVLRIRQKGEEILKRYDNTFYLDQLMLAWLLKLPSEILPVVGTGRLDRLEKAAASIFIHITDEEWFELLEAAHGHEVA